MPLDREVTCDAAVLLTSLSTTTVDTSEQEIHVFLLQLEMEKPLTVPAT
jgi:hypothetical protein